MSEYPAAEPSAVSVHLTQDILAAAAKVVGGDVEGAVIILEVAGVLPASALAFTKEHPVAAEFAIAVGLFLSIAYGPEVGSGVIATAGLETAGQIVARAVVNFALSEGPSALLGLYETLNPNVGSPIRVPNLPGSFTLVPGQLLAGQNYITTPTVNGQSISTWWEFPPSMQNVNAGELDLLLANGQVPVTLNPGTWSQIKYTDPSGILQVVLQNAQTHATGPTVNFHTTTGTLEIDGAAGSSFTLNGVSLLTISTLASGDTIINPGTASDITGSQHPIIIVNADREAAVATLANETLIGSGQGDALTATAPNQTLVDLNGGALIGRSGDTFVPAGGSQLIKTTDSVLTAPTTIYFNPSSGINDVIDNAELRFDLYGTKLPYAANSSSALQNYVINFGSLSPSDVTFVGIDDIFWYGSQKTYSEEFRLGYVEVKSTQATLVLPDGLAGTEENSGVPGKQPTIKFTLPNSLEFVFDNSSEVYSGNQIASLYGNFNGGNNAVFTTEVTAQGLPESSNGQYDGGRGTLKQYAWAPFLSGGTKNSLVGGLDPAPLPLLSALTSYGGAPDPIVDGSAGGLTIVGPSNEITTVIYTDATSAVTVDLATGISSEVGVSDDILINVQNVVGSAFGDTLIGDGAGNTLIGGVGNDTLISGGGNGTLIGGAGNNVLNGTGGVATADYIGASEAVTLNLSTGIAANNGYGGTDTLVSISDVLADGSGDTLIGGVSATAIAEYGNQNVLEAGAGPTILEALSGSNTLIGGSGSDTFIVSDGNNTLIGGTGTTVVNYTNISGNITVNLSTGIAASNSFITNDTLTGITGVIAAGSGDTLIGSSGAQILSDSGGSDLLEAGSGATVLQATGGDSTLVGGAGDDTFVLGGGGNTVDGGSGSNTVDYSEAATAVTVNLSAGTATSSAFSLADTLSQIAAVIGSGFDDTLIGDGNNVLIGNGTLIDGGGSNTLEGLGGVATADYASAPGSVTVDLSTGLAKNGYGGSDTLIGISDVIGSSSGSTLIGDGGATTGSNVLEGGAGNDTLIALGSGSLGFGGGQDTLIGGGGNNVLIGTGTDATADYAGAPGSVTVDLSTGLAENGYGGTDTLVGVSDVIGSSSGSTLIGDGGVATGSNVLEGGAGNDTLIALGSGSSTLSTGTVTLIGGGGNNVLIGTGADATADYAGAPASVTVNLSTGLAENGYGGTDTLTGISAVLASGTGDTLIGGSGTETLTETGTGDLLEAGSGSDELVALGGSNTLVGGSGSDLFVVAGGDNTVIGGAGSDTIYYVDDAGAAVTVSLSAGQATSSGFSGHDVLSGIAEVIAGGSGDTLIGGSGAQTLVDSGDNDLLEAGSGATVLQATGGDSTLIGGAGNDTFVLSGGGNTVEGGTGNNTVDYSEAAAPVTIDLTAGTATSSAFSLADTLSQIAAVIGSGFDDTLIGDGNNVLIGNGTLIDGGGSNTLEGLGGVATADYAGAPGSVTVDLSTGLAENGYGGTDTLIGVSDVIGSASGSTLIGDGGVATGSNVLEGGAGNDTLIALGSGSSTLLTGTVTLIGGGGNNVLIGTGTDATADYAGTPASVTVDLSMGLAENGYGGTDTLIGVSDVIGSALGGTLIAGSGAETFTIGAGGGDTVIGDATGPTAISFADASAGVTVDLSAGHAYSSAFSLADTLSQIAAVIGSGFDDTLIGDGNNMLVGNGTLIDGGGSNVLKGLGGLATADYADAPGSVTVDLSTGLAENGYGGTDTLVGVSDVIGSSSGSTLIGDGGVATGSNVLEGGAGNDTLIALGSGSSTLSTGTVTLIGGGGNNVLIGTGADATADYAGAPGSVTVDLSTGLAENGYGGTDTLVDVSDVIGSAFGGTLIASSGAEIFTIGAGGGDTVVGNATGPTTISFAEATAGVTVDLSTGHAYSSAFSLADTLSQIAAVIGSGFDDTLIGDGNNVLIGNGTLIDGGGSNTLEGLGGVATADYASAPGSVTVDLSTGLAKNGYGGSDTLIGISDVIGSSSGSTLIGDGGATTGSNVLEGGAGNDTLIALGSGSLGFGGGQDTLIGGGGNNVLIGTGTDATADYAGAPGSVTVDLSTGLAENGYGGTDTLVGVSDVIGSSSGSTLIGDGGVATGSNVLEGGAGNDTLIALGSGSSTLSTGTVTLIGGGGNNVLIGTGADATADYAGAPASVTVNLSTGLAENGYGGTDTLTGISAVLASGTGDTLIGGSGTETLTETGTGDLLEAGSGSDELVALGGSNTLVGGSGSDLFVVAGGDNTVIGGAGSDTIYYVDDAGAAVTVSLSAGQATSSGFSGHDVLSGIAEVIAGGSGDTLIGGSGAQTLVDSGDNDLLEAGSGATVLQATGGDSTLIGGAGNDTFVLSGGGNTVEGGTGNNTVDYSEAAAPVTIDLTAGTATSSGFSGADHISNVTSVLASGDNNVIEGATASGTLSIISGNDNTLIAGTGGGSLSATGEDNTLIAGSGNAVLTISGDDDVLIGGSGNDTFDVTQGDGDTLIAGSGIDTFIGAFDRSTVLSFATAAAGVTVDLSTGTATGAGLGDDSLQNIENVIGSALDDTLIGDNGDDTFTLGSGADTVIGNMQGQTTVSYATATAGVTVNLSTGVATGASISGDSLTDVNNVIGSNYADTLIAGSANAVLDGGAGGTDTLVSGTGNDTLIGSAMGSNTVSYASLSTGMTVDLIVGTATDASGKTDTLENIQNVVGSATGNDTIIGGSDAGTFIGGTGNESFVAGTGNESFIGGSGNNTVSFQNLLTGVTADLATGTATATSGASYDLTSIENLIGGVGPDTLIGNAGNNVLQAGSGIATLVGGGGHNTLESFNGGVATADYAGASAGVVVDLSEEEATANGYGTTDSLFGISNVIASAFDSTLIGDGGFFSGSNVLEGGAGNDTLIAVGHGFLTKAGGSVTLIGGAGNNVLIGTGAAAMADYAGAPAAVTVDLSTGIAENGYGGTDSLVGISGVIATGSDNTLIGDSGNDTFSITGGGNTIVGGSGTNTLDYTNAVATVTVDLSTGVAASASFSSNDAIGGISEVVAGGTGDTLIGGSGAETLVDGGNADILNAGSGPTVLEAVGVNNTLIGGAGNDTFVLAGGGNTIDGGSAANTIDYSPAADSVTVDLTSGLAFSSGFSEPDILLGIENVIGSSFNDTLIGNSSNNLLVGGSGATLIGGGGDNTLEGESGGATADYANAPSGVTVDLSYGMAANGYGDTDTLINISNAIGSAFGSTLIGSGQYGSLLEGGVGNDTLIAIGSGPSATTGGYVTLIGGGGSNVLNGTNAVATADYAAATAGVTVDLSTGLAENGYGGTDSLVAISNVIGSAFGSTLIGDGGVATGANVLVGGGGNDTLIALGSGTSMLADGVVTLIGGAGDNVLNGTGAAALADYAGPNFNGAPEAVTVDLSAGVATNNGYGGRDTLVSVDNVVANGTGDTLLGGSGDDTLTEDGAVNFLEAGSGPSTLQALSGNNTLIGGAGDDTLVVANGGNTLVGGPGATTADYTNAGSDLTIDLSMGYAAGSFFATNDTLTGIVNVVADGPNDTLIGGSDTQTLWINSGYNDTLIAGSSNELLYTAGDGDTLVGGTGADTLIGENGDDLLQASADSNVLVGLNGDNTLLSSASLDTLVGSGGDDTLVASSDSAYDTLMVTDGDDNTLSSSGYGDTLIAGTGADTLSTSGYAETLLAGTGDDTLLSTGAHAILLGGSGSDVLISTDDENTLVSGGDNTLLSSGAYDTLVGSSGADTLDALAGSFDDTLIAGDGDNTLLSSGNASTLIGGTGADFLDSTDVENTLLAGSGDNTLVSSGAYDTLVGNGGAMTLVASVGSYEDTLIAGDGDNTLLSSGNGNKLLGGGGADLLSSADYDNTLIAGSGDTTLVSSGAGDTLIAGTGTDTLLSSGGSNTLVGGSSPDYLSSSDYANLLLAGSGDNTLVSSGSYDTLMGSDSADTLIASAGSYEDTLIAGDGGNSLLSSGNANTLVGGSGSDFLSSTDYENTLVAGDGDNTLSSSGANDTLIGGAGSDTLVGASGSYEATLIAGDGDNTLLSSGNANTLIGGAGADFLSSTDEENTLLAGSGDNILVSTGTSDTLIGGSGTDTLSSSGVGNTLIGGSGADLISSSGTDTLIAGSGTDTLIGNGYNASTEVAEYYQFGPSTGQATIVNGSSSTTDPTNELDFTGGLSDEDLWLLQTGNNLQVDLLGTTNTVSINGWFAGSQNQLKEITASGLELDTQVSQLVQAMATYSTDNPGFNPQTATSMPTDSALQNAIANAWHT